MGDRFRPSFWMDLALLSGFCCGCVCCCLCFCFWLWNVCFGCVFLVVCACCLCSRSTIAFSHVLFVLDIIRTWSRVRSLCGVSLPVSLRVRSRLGVSLPLNGNVHNLSLVCRSRPYLLLPTSKLSSLLPLSHALAVRSRLPHLSLRHWHSCCALFSHYNFLCHPIYKSWRA